MNDFTAFVPAGLMLELILKRDAVACQTAISSWILFLEAEHFHPLLHNHHHHHSCLLPQQLPFQINRIFHIPKMNQPSLWQMAVPRCQQFLRPYSDSLIRFSVPSEFFVVSVIFQKGAKETRNHGFFCYLHLDRTGQFDSFRTFPFEQVSF